MPTSFLIDDDIHADAMSEHATFEEAVAELKRLASLPWDAEPNIAPCIGWPTCGRRYDIVELDSTRHPAYKERRHMPALRISAAGVVWLSDLTRDMSTITVTVSRSKNGTWHVGEVLPRSLDTPDMDMSADSLDALVAKVEAMIPELLQSAGRSPDSRGAHFVVHVDTRARRE